MLNVFNRLDFFTILLPVAFQISKTNFCRCECFNHGTYPLRFSPKNFLICTPQAADGVSSSYDDLADLFECIGNFLKRLRIYTDIPLTPSMTDVIVQIMVELLSVLALATKQIKQGRFSKRITDLNSWQLNMV